MKERTKAIGQFLFTIFGACFFGSVSIIAYGSIGFGIFGLGVLSGMGLIAGLFLLIKSKEENLYIR